MAESGQHHRAGAPWLRLARSHCGPVSGTGGSTGPPSRRGSSPLPVRSLATFEVEGRKSAQPGSAGQRRHPLRADLAVHQSQFAQPLEAGVRQQLRLLQPDATLGQVQAAELAQVLRPREGERGLPSETVQLTSNDSRRAGKGEPARAAPFPSSVSAPSSSPPGAAARAVRAPRPECIPWGVRSRLLRWRWVSRGQRGRAGPGGTRPLP